MPAELTDKLNDFMRVMKGTNSPTPRCIALQGTIGERIWCSIYEQRSSVCREFPVAWENGEPHDRCDKARAAWGLPPLTPNSWIAFNMLSSIEEKNSNQNECPDLMLTR